MAPFDRVKLCTKWIHSLAQGICIGFIILLIIACSNGSPVSTSATENGTAVQNVIDDGDAEHTGTLTVIYDDDGSQDGMTALAYLLQHPRVDVRAVTISQGLAYPNVFIDNLARMLTRLGETDIAIAAGAEDPIVGENAFPELWRGDTSTFFEPFVMMPEEATVTPDQQDAADLIIATVMESETPVTILATGSMTNIAEALRREPAIANNLDAVHVMGGAVFVPGNLAEAPDGHLGRTNEFAEWNIWIDPLAAQEVFESDIPIFLVPLDATNQINFAPNVLDVWREAGSEHARIASEFFEYALTVVMNNDVEVPNPVWDLVAAINMVESDFCNEALLPLEVVVDSEPGDTQGHTRVVPGKPANVYVCVNPDFTALEQGSIVLFE